MQASTAPASVRQIVDPLPPAQRDESPVLSLRKGSLVPEGFVFDDSQIAALASLALQTHGNLIGAAGSGKTTCTKAFVQHIADQVSAIDSNYDKVGTEGHFVKMIPSILLCSFTGRAVRQIKKNFPHEWHSNIMTIHRALRYAPEIVLGEDEFGKPKEKRIFLPRHTEQNRMPWDIIIIDESSMVACDLWQNFYAAMKPNTRVYMVGDLNQLPPVQGRSIFGYALAKWNIAELTHIHRQKGSNDAIVPNAHRILKGLPPEEGVNFKMRRISQYPREAKLQIIAMVQNMHQKNAFNPLYDGIITAVNGDKWESPSAPLGQITLNEPLSRYFNLADAEGNPRKRLVIDAGRQRKIFAIGDKVMATKNDYETGITNGMMGVITDVFENRSYTGDRSMIGDLEAVQLRQEELSQLHGAHIDTDELISQIEDDIDANGRDSNTKESALKGAASHSIVVDFRACEADAADDESDDTNRFITFYSRSEVESLQLAYASTCHKMQGAECPTTIVICHEVFGRMLTREWLYTACTRASKRLLLLYTDKGLSKALATQRVKGTTVRQKAESFRMLMEEATPRQLKLNQSFTKLLPEAMELTEEGKLK